MEAEQVVKLWTVKAAAAMLGISTRTLYRLRADGAIVLQKVRGKTVVAEPALLRYQAKIGAIRS